MNAHSFANGVVTSARHGEEEIKALSVGKVKVLIEIGVQTFSDESKRGETVFTLARYVVHVLTSVQRRRGVTRYKPTKRR